MNLEINEINSKYVFYRIDNINININVNSLNKLSNFNMDKKMLEMVVENNYNIKTTLQNILINRKNYALYCAELDRLIHKIKLDNYNKNEPRILVPLKILYLKLKKKKVKLNFNVFILVSYTSPAGRNYYELKFNYNYDDILQLELKNNKEKFLVFSKKKEQNKINTVKCIFCNKMIDSDSLYCSFCGKRQINENNLNSIKNSNYSNLTSVSKLKSNSYLKNKTIFNNFLNKNINNNNQCDNWQEESEKNEELSEKNDLKSLDIKEINDTIKLKESIDLNKNININNNNQCDNWQEESEKNEELSEKNDLKSLDIKEINDTIKLKESIDLNKNININNNNQCDNWQEESEKQEELSEKNDLESLEIKEINDTLHLKDNADLNKKTTRNLELLKSSTYGSNTKKCLYESEKNYLKKSFMISRKKKKIKFDNGNFIYENFSGYIGFVSNEYYHSKTEKVLEQYFKKKYLGMEIHNYKIIDVYVDLLVTPIRDEKKLRRSKYIYFVCKCKKCARIINQVSDDFFRNPIICKCNLEKNVLKSKIDLVWESNLDLYMKRIYDEIALPEGRKTDFYDVYIDDCFTFYYIYNNKLNRAGFSKIVKFDVGKKFVIGDVKIPFNNKFSIFNNVYFYLDIDYKFKFCYFYKEYCVFNPILYYYDNDKYYDINEYIKNKTTYKNEIKSYVFIYFEKTNSTGYNYDKKNVYKMNVYCDDKLIFQKNNIIEIEKKFFDDLSSLVFKLQVKDEKNSQSYYSYQFSILEKKFELCDIDYFHSCFYKSNTNIIVNTNNLDTELVETIKKYNKYDNKKYRKIYIHKTAYETGWVLYEYLKNDPSFKILKNEFNDDKNPNYFALIDRNDKEKNEFINYILSKSSDHHSCECNIYEHSVNSLCRILLLNKNNVNRILNAITKTHVIEIEDKAKEEYIISHLKDCSFENRNYETDYYIKKFSYYKQIINKLKEKYSTDDLGLILIFLNKYGEDIAFSLPNYYSKFNEKNEFNLLYNNLLNKSGFKKTKWKSEYNLFLLVKCYFNDAIFQYKFKELGNQSLDIFIPSLNIAFEYQGKQHYEIVNFFGGQERLSIQMKHDELKKKICENNSIILIEWNYKKKINKFELDKCLMKYKKIVEKCYEFIPDK